MQHEQSLKLRLDHTRNGHQLRIKEFSSHVPLLKNCAGTFEICSCGWEGWLAVIEEEHFV